MPVRNRYNLVDDVGDSQIPIHNEEAYQHGINFQAKYVGSLNMPRPSSRVEIVAAMRRIRNEFKAKCIMKKKVSIIISVDGVKVVLWKKQKRKGWIWDESKMLVMHDPIYRIFYVSHDSRELKVFSYIARDGSGSSFRCNVFKSKKKAQAVCIVRTLGQAFEVCHQMSLQRTQGHADNQAVGVSESQEENVFFSEALQSAKGYLSKDEEDEQKGTEKVSMNEKTLKDYGNKEDLAGLQSNKFLEHLGSQDKEGGLTSTEEACCPSGSALTSLSSQHHLRLLQQQLLQQETQTQVALAQVRLLGDQLEAEAAARVEAQSRVHHLLAQNSILLQHVALLVQQLKDLESKVQATKCDGQVPTQESTAPLNMKNRGLGCSDPEDASTPAALAETRLSLLSLENKAQLDARKQGSDPFNREGTQDVEMSSHTLRKVAEWFNQAVPKLNPPPPFTGRKRAIVAQLQSPAKPTSEMVAADTSSRGSLSDSVCLRYPGDACSLDNSESESCSASEDSGVVRSDKCPLSPEHEAPFEDQAPCVSPSSSYSGHLEERDRFRSSCPPLLPSRSPEEHVHMSSLSSLAQLACLHLSLSEDELLKTESPDSSAANCT